MTAFNLSRWALEHKSFVVYLMLVVTLADLTFVTTLDRAAELRPLLDALPDEIRNVSRG